MQQNIGIVGRLARRDMLQTEFQSTVHKIDNQWPLEIAVAISADENDTRSDGAQLIEDCFCANISKMPDFVCVFGHFLHISGQTIVRVRKDKNTQRPFRFFVLPHVAF